MEESEKPEKLKGVFKKTQLGQYQQELWNAVWMRREMASPDILLWVTPRRVGRNVLKWLPIFSATIFSATATFQLCSADLSQPSEKKLNLHTWHLSSRGAMKCLRFLWDLSMHKKTWLSGPAILRNEGAPNALNPLAADRKSWLAPGCCRRLWMLRL